MFLFLKSPEFCFHSQLATYAIIYNSKFEEECFSIDVSRKNETNETKKENDINAVAQHTFEWNADTFSVRYLHTLHSTI